MNTKPSFFSELRRRNVFRVALTYAVVAWLLIETAGVVLPTVGAPEWLITTFVALLALGFALALFISWSFEMTPEGLKRTEDLSPDEVLPYWSRRKFATFIIGTAIIAFGLSAYQLLMPKPVTASKVEANSVQQQTNVLPSTEGATSNSLLEQTFRDLDARWSKAAAARDLVGTVAFYSNDAIVLPPNAASAATNEAIRNVWRDLLATPGLAIRWQPAKVQLAKSGEMAWVSGVYELTRNDPTGKPVNDRGKYLEVWEKQADGNWKCRVDMWNSSLPISEPPPVEKK